MQTLINHARLNQHLLLSKTPTHTRTHKHTHTHDIHTDLSLAHSLVYVSRLTIINTSIYTPYIHSLTQCTIKNKPCTILLHNQPSHTQIHTKKPIKHQIQQNQIRLTSNRLSNIPISNPSIHTCIHLLSVNSHPTYSRTQSADKYHIRGASMRMILLKCVIEKMFELRMM
jgi:hypothetical protein